MLLFWFQIQKRSCRKLCKYKYIWRFLLRFVSFIICSMCHDSYLISQASVRGSRDERKYEQSGYLEPWRRIWRFFFSYPDHHIQPMIKMLHKISRLSVSKYIQFLFTEFDNSTQEEDPYLRLQRSLFMLNVLTSMFIRHPSANTCKI